MCSEILPTAALALLVSCVTFSACSGSSYLCTSCSPVRCILAVTVILASSRKRTGAPKPYLDSEPEISQYTVVHTPGAVMRVATVQVFKPRCS